jgi:hypothetical protein
MELHSLTWEIFIDHQICRLAMRPPASPVVNLSNTCRHNADQSSRVSRQMDWPHGKVVDHYKTPGKLTAHLGQWQHYLHIALLQ